MTLQGEWARACKLTRGSISFEEMTVVGWGMSGDLDPKIRRFQIDSNREVNNSRRSEFVFFPLTR